MLDNALRIVSKCSCDWPGEKTDTPKRGLHQTFLAGAKRPSLACRLYGTALRGGEGACPVATPRWGPVGGCVRGRVALCLPAPIVAHASTNVQEVSRRVGRQSGVAGAKRLSLLHTKNCHRVVSDLGGISRQGARARGQLSNPSGASTRGCEGGPAGGWMHEPLLLV